MKKNSKHICKSYKLYRNQMYLKWQLRKTRLTISYRITLLNLKKSIKPAIEEKIDANKMYMT